MSQPDVAKRYAVALFELANEKALLDQMEDELRFVSDAFTSDDNVKQIIDNPRLSTDKKKQFIRDSFSPLSKDMVNTLQLLVERRRMNVLPEIVSAFVEMKNQHYGIAQADVYSTHELSEAETKKIEDVFTKLLDKNTLRIRNIIDPDLIGGLRIRIGNKIYDGTVKTQLQKIERRLLSRN